MKKSFDETKEQYKKLDLATKALAMDAKEPFTSASLPFPFPKVFREKMLLARDNDDVKLDVIKIAEVPGICHLPFSFSLF